MKKRIRILCGLDQNLRRLLIPSSDKQNKQHKSGVWLFYPLPSRALFLFLVWVVTLHSHHPGLDNVFENKAPYGALFLNLTRHF